MAMRDEDLKEIERVVKVLNDSGVFGPVSQDTGILVQGQTRIALAIERVAEALERMNRCRPSGGPG